MPNTLPTPLVSVVIPARNAAEDLPEALFSVARQGIDAYEILVADDGSTDGTDALLVDANRKDRRILQLRTGGVGPAIARNRAIEEARAPLIAFLDADDRWRPGKLAAQIEFHHRFPAATFSLTDYQHRSIDGADLGAAFPFWPRWRHLADTEGEVRLLRDAAPRIFAENAVGTATVVARRAAILTSGGFDPSLRSASDWEMWIRLALAGPVGHSTGIGMDYRMVPGSVTSNKALRIACMERIVEMHGPAIRALGDRSALRAATARLDVARAEMARAQAEPFKALTHHVRAVLTDPNLRVARAALADVKSLLAA